MTKILLGTCGWSYAEWEGILYPQKQAKPKQYSSIFPTTEIDSTFYSLPKQEIVLGWARNTPSNFIFSAKLPQTITHKKVLDVARGIEADLNQFIEIMKPLIDARKLACALVQLPPFLRFNAERFESFLSILPGTPRFAVEFRHDSWLNDEALKMLEAPQRPGLPRLKSLSAEPHSLFLASLSSASTHLILLPEEQFGQCAFAGSKTRRKEKKGKEEGFVRQACLRVCLVLVS